MNWRGPDASVLQDTLAFLEALSRDAALPPEAQSRLTSLTGRHPGARIKLLWQEELFDGSFHYDALLGVPEGTLSLSYCPDRALPWPLRGVQRWNDRDLARVDDAVLEVMDAVRLIDLVWDEQRLTDRLLNACVIRAELDREPVEVAAAELQAAVDASRRARGLYTVDATNRWLDRRGLTHHDLEASMAEQIEITMLKERLTAPHVEAYFETNRALFESARIARIEVAAETDAERLAADIRSGIADFLEAAQRRFLDVPPGASARETFVSVRRREAGDALGAAVFGANPGDLVGPVRTGTSYAVVRVLDRAEARLDDATRADIKEILFQDWLAERREAVTVEWYWGKGRPASSRSGASAAAPSPEPSTPGR